MHKRLLLQFALLGTVALLTLIALQQRGTERSTEAQPVHRLPSTEVAGVRQLIIDRETGSRVHLTRTDGAWFVEEPFAGPAHDRKVNELLRIVGLASRVQLAAAEHDLVGFGLAPPNATLQVDALRFEFGDTDPLAGQRYVKSGAHIYLTHDLIYHHVSSDAATFAEPSLIDPGREIVQLELPDQTILLVDGSWLDSSGADASQLVDAWQQATAVRVTSSYTTEAAASVTVRFARGDEVHFGIVEREPSLVLSRRDRQLRYELPEGASASLLSISAATLEQEQH